MQSFLVQKKLRCKIKNFGYKTIFGPKYIWVQKVKKKWVQENILAKKHWGGNKLSKKDVGPQKLQKLVLNIWSKSGQEKLSFC